MKSSYNGVAVPSNGKAIEYAGGKFHVPDQPIIPFIEGDGTGRDIWKASRRVFDAAVEKAYGGKTKIAWLEVFAGEKAFNQFKEWLPQDTVDAIRDFRVAIKGPLTTPVGGGIRSLNVTLRQVLDLYACVRPVRYFDGVPSPVKQSRAHERRDLSRKYGGRVRRNRMEVRHSRSEKADRFLEQRNAERNARNTSARFRRRHQADLADRHEAPGASRDSARDRQQAARVVTLVHKGNIMKFTEGAFRDWGYELATEEFRPQIVTERESWILGNKDHDANLTIEKNAAMIEPGLEQATEDFKKADLRRSEETLDSIYATHGKGQWKKKILINDRIADSVFQQVLTRADEYQVFATPNLNGDYLSDACAAQVGGLGMAPGANIGDGFGVFRSHARHRAEICRQGRDQSQLRDALRLDDVRFHGLERSRRN